MTNINAYTTSKQRVLYVQQGPFYLFKLLYKTGQDFLDTQKTSFDKNQRAK